MALLNKQKVGRAGLAPAYSAATAGGDTVRPDPNLILHIKNGSAGAVTVTVSTPGKVGDLDVADAAVNVPAGADAFIGPLDPATFAQPVTGLANVTYSAAAGVTIAALTH